MLIAVLCKLSFDVVALAALSARVCTKALVPPPPKHGIHSFSFIKLRLPQERHPRSKENYSKTPVDLNVMKETSNACKHETTYTDDNDDDDDDDDDP